MADCLAVWPRVWQWVVARGFLITRMMQCEVRSCAIGCFWPGFGQAFILYAEVYAHPPAEDPLVVAPLEERSGGVAKDANP